MKLILHIGFPKTGTSSIQTFLSENTERLKQSKILYLMTPGRVEYRDLALVCMSFKRTDAYTRHVLSQSDLSREALVADLRESIIQELKDIDVNAYDTVVISSEHLSSRLRTSEEVERLKEIVAPFFSEVEVFAYIREQVNRIPSQYSTYIKSGGVLSFDKFITKSLKSPGMKYDKSLGNWLVAFDKSTVNVRVFDKREFVGGGLISDFIDFVGLISISDFYYPSAEVNPAISVKAGFFMLLFNRYLPDVIKANPAKRESVVNFLCRFKGAKYSLSEADKLSIERHFLDSNNETKRLFFSDRTELFLDKN